MDGDRLEALLARIDRSLDRIEAAAEAPRGDAALAERHERLRRAAQTAVAELDALIAAGAT